MDDRDAGGDGVLVSTHLFGSYQVLHMTKKKPLLK
jgi:hypothetical protein